MRLANKLQPFYHNIDIFATTGQKRTGKTTKTQRKRYENGIDIHIYTHFATNTLRKRYAHAKRLDFWPFSNVSLQCERGKDGPKHPPGSKHTHNSINHCRSKSRFHSPPPTDKNRGAEQQNYGNTLFLGTENGKARQARRGQQDLPRGTIPATAGPAGYGRAHDQPWQQV